MEMNIPFKELLDNSDSELKILNKVSKILQKCCWPDLTAWIIWLHLKNLDCVGWFLKKNSSSRLRFFKLNEFFNIPLRHAKRARGNSRFWTSRKGKILKEMTQRESNTLLQKYCWRILIPSWRIWLDSKNLNWVEEFRKEESSSWVRFFKLIGFFKDTAGRLWLWNKNYERNFQWIPQKYCWKWFW